VKLTVFLGLALGLLVAFPALAVPVMSVAHWLALQPVVWAFAAGIVARPRIARRLPRRVR
jgi:hypothetical protein